MTLTFDHTHDDCCDHSVTKVRCKDLPDSDRGDFRCRRAVDSSTGLHNLAEHYNDVIMGR